MSSKHETSTMPPWDGPAILLVDLDAFFASVEQLDHPQWRGKPVIVGGDASKRGVVSTCSYEARAYGVRSAMASKTAQRLCPEAIWTRGRHERYAEISRQVMDVLLSHSPRIQQVSIDEAFLDVTPGRFVREHPVAIASHIQESVAKLGVTCSIGLGTTKTVAKIASDKDKPNGLTVVYPGGEDDFLSPLPVRELSGIGLSTARRLNSLGIMTLGDLAKADDQTMLSLFGKNAQTMLLRARGQDASAVDGAHDVKSVSNEVTFAQDITEYEQIRQAVAKVATKVGRRLRRERLAGYTVSLKARLADLSIHSAQRTLPHAVDDERDFIPVLNGLIREVWRPGMSLRLIGVGVSSFDARPEQLALFGDDFPEGGLGGGGAAVAASRPGGSQASAAASAERQEGGLGGGGGGAATPSKPAGGLAQDAEAIAGRKGGRADRRLIEAADRVKDRFGEDALRFGRELAAGPSDTGTIPG
jgi:DNA polymerase-4